MLWDCEFLIKNRENFTINIASYIAIYRVPIKQVVLQKLGGLQLHNKP